MKKRILWIFLLLMYGITPSFAQIEVKGVVLDDKHQPLIGGRIDYH